MFETEMPEAVGALEALGRRTREIERAARIDPRAFYTQQQHLAFEHTVLAFLIRSVRSLLLILTAQNALLDDVCTHTEACDLEGPAYNPRLRSI